MKSIEEELGGSDSEHQEIKEFELKIKKAGMPKEVLQRAKKELGNNNNSVIIEKDNLKQLTDAISDLYQNKEKRNLLGKNARKFCEENFDIKKIAEIYKEIYKEI